MINTIIDQIKTHIDAMKETIHQDIEDIKAAQHDKLLDRNEIKHQLMDQIVQLKQQLNEALVAQLKAGNDVNIFRDNVNSLEEELRSLYALNGKLASIVLPLKEMYKEIVDDITVLTGKDKLIDVKA